MKPDLFCAACSRRPSDAEPETTLYPCSVCGVPRWISTAFGRRMVKAIRPLDNTPDEPPISGDADTEWETRLQAERVTLELKQKSTRRVDAGKQPITDSPLFGGPSQGGLF